MSPQNLQGRRPGNGKETMGRLDISPTDGDGPGEDSIRFQAAGSLTGTGYISESIQGTDLMKMGPALGHIMDPALRLRQNIQGGKGFLQCLFLEA